MWIGKGLAIIAALIVTTSQAHADWRYCLALSDAAKRVYMSNPFASEAENGAVESLFERLLVQTQIPHDRVQCPQAESERQLKAMRSHAAVYNREFLGRSTVDLPWVPNPTLEVQRRAGAAQE